MLLRKMFSRKWVITTVLVIVGTLILIRLGIWQLDRLQQRRAFNAQVESSRSQNMLDLNGEVPGNLDTMEWRAVQVTGKYDLENQVAIRNQYYDKQYGYHLMTPLLFDGEVVLVDRGWIPADGNSKTTDWHKYDETGEVKVTGQIRLGSGKPSFGGIEDAAPAAGSRLEFWNNADVDKISQQLPYPILKVYIQPASNPEDVQPPIPFQPVLELTEGPHFGYAMQWFIFASLLFFGYPYYLKKQETSRT